VHGERDVHVDGAAPVSEPAPETAADRRPKHGGKRPGAGRPRTHGLRGLRTAVTQLTTRRLDGRTLVARAVRQWKEDVRRDLGGDLSRAQETVLEGAARKLVLRDSLADFLARQPTIVTKKRQALPVLASFLQVTDSLNRDLERLGLERKQKRIDIVAELAALQRGDGQDGGGGDDGDGTPD